MEKELEEHLIHRIQHDPKHFSVLFDAHYASIFNYVLRRVSDLDIAKDICSETFLKAFINVNKFVWKGIPISFWLYRIAGNEIMQFHRKKRYTPYSLDVLVGSQAWDRVDPWEYERFKLQIENERKQEDDFDLVQQQVKKLPIYYQEVIALRYFERKSIKEISLILEKKEGTVKSLLSRGIDKLRQLVVK